MKFVNYLFNNQNIYIQMNQASHFLDGSVLYGSTVKKMKSLRTKWGGRLITTLQKNGAEYPSIANPQKLPCHLMNSSECFNAGKFNSVVLKVHMDDYNFRVEPGSRFSHT